jgi:hypothetical protein
MQRLTEIIRLAKCALGILLIVSFFLPWVAETPSCLDKSVVIRDNISGFSLAREGTAPEAWLAPLFGAVVAAVALILRARAAPLARSLVSLLEIPGAVLAVTFVDLSVRLFAPVIVRYGYVVAAGVLWTIPLLSFSEVVTLFGRLTKAGKITVVAAGVLLIVPMLFDWLSNLVT